MGNEKPDIKAIAERFQQLDTQVSDLEAQLAEVKRLRSEAREELLTAVTRHDLDEFS